MTTLAIRDLDTPAQGNDHGRRQALAVERATTPPAERDADAAVLRRTAPLEAATILQTFAFNTHGMCTLPA